VGFLRVELNTPSPYGLGRLPQSAKKASFVIYLVGWAALHGLTVFGLMRWVEAIYWIPILIAELFIGYFAAYLSFDVP
jgi:hypothetical protein